MKRTPPQKQWLARPLKTIAWQSVGDRVPYWVETDSYDAEAFAHLCRDLPSLRAAEATGQKFLPHFSALLFDLYALLYKATLVFRPPEQVLPSAFFHKALLDAIVDAPAFEALRLQTVLDERQSGLAALTLGERLLGLLRSERLVNRAQMLDFWALHHQETELRRIEEEARSARELVEQFPEARRSHLAPLSERLHREAAVLQRNLAWRARDAEKAARELLERQGSHLHAEVGRTAVIVHDAQQQLQQWPGHWGGTSGDSVGLQIELGKKLAENPRLQKLARLVGRMRTHSWALRRRVYERASEETHAVVQGSDWSRLLPCELVALRHPWRRREFRRRLLEGSLLQYELRGQQRRSRGPMVVCLDVSSSMSGDKEIWAKAIALTLLDIAQRQRRLFRAICFSGADQPLFEIDLNPRQRYESEPHRVLEFASYFPGGSTDFQKPLDAAVATLQRAEYRKGDIVFITDGECAVDPAWLQQFRDHKQRLEFRLLSVLIDVGTANTNVLRQFSDRVTSVRQLTAESGADLFLAL